MLTVAPLSPLRRVWPDREDRVYVHWKLRNGRIVYVYEYADRAEALEAAGLSE
jgi:hypothetical protein